jgi:hypothetical protein
MSDNGSKRFVYRALFAYSLLLPAIWFVGDDYAALLTPLYQWTIEHVEPLFHVQNVAFRESNGRQLFHFAVTTAKPMVVDGHVLPTGIGLSASTLSGHAMQHLLIVFFIAASWPARHWVEYSYRLIFVAVALLIIEMADVPLMIVGTLMDLLLANLAPDRLSSNAWVVWMNTMNGGGRIALSVSGGLISVLVSAAISRTVIKKLALTTG